MPAITTINLFNTLRAMLMAIVPGVEIVKGLGNAVSMPRGAFISMTNVGIRRLATNRYHYDDPVTARGAARDTVGTLGHEQATAIDIQVDCYGPQSANWAASIATLWRDPFATRWLKPVDAAPLTCEDPRMIPLENSAKNYEERWVALLTLQYNPLIETPMYFFDNMDLFDNMPLIEEITP